MITVCPCWGNRCQAISLPHFRSRYSSLRSFKLSYSDVWFNPTCRFSWSFCVNGNITVYLSTCNSIMLSWDRRPRMTLWWRGLRCGKLTNLFVFNRLLSPLRMMHHKETTYESNASGFEGSDLELHDILRLLEHAWVVTRGIIHKSKV